LGCLLALSTATEHCGDYTTGEECSIIDESSTIGEILVIDVSWIKALSTSGASIKCSTCTLIFSPSTGASTEQLSTNITVSLKITFLLSKTF